MTTYKDIADFIDQQKELLLKKGSEYATNANIYHNFDSAAGFHNNGTNKLALWGFLVKHLVSIKDHCENNIQLSQSQIDEKTGDIIIYMALLAKMK
jgi:hypothetical protein